mmetsp:Transcript_63304/g.165788  ORF Transcript_63304/g.165788 Transcript_63304/m.165788 type:complete len:321 (+) Transcript_63304:96-1058(+)
MAFVPKLSFTDRLGLPPVTPRTAPTAHARLTARDAPAGIDHGLTPRNTEFIKASARQMLKPQVGLGRMVSALGSTKPAWESKTPKGGRVDRALEAMAVRDTRDTISASPRREYHVGRARARGQLRVAMDTHNEEAQLRRLVQALEIPTVQYDQNMPGLHQAVGQAARLSARLQGGGKQDAVILDQLLCCAAAQPMLPPRGRPNSVQEDLVEHAKRTKLAKEAEELAQEEWALQEELGPDVDVSATRIQAAFRGKKDRAEVEQKRKESAAAIKIQSRCRGKAARSAEAARGKAEELLQERYAGLMDADVEEEAGEEDEPPN